MGGDQFGEEYRGNAFVPEPGGNLIKRLVGIDDSPGEIEVTARFAAEAGAASRPRLSLLPGSSFPPEVYDAADLFRLGRAE